jgi:hypothetical protein
MIGRASIAASVLFLFFAGCSSGAVGGEQDSRDPSAEADSASTNGQDALADVNTDTRVDPVGDADAPPAKSPVPVLAVKNITGATSAEVTMIGEGVALANETMATKCFEDFVLSASWTETGGLTQAQIWDKLCGGTMTVDVDMYLGSWYENNVSRTIGYEKEPGIVHMNRYFVKTAYMVADNLIHEAEGHSQGFTHYGVKSTSVPYGLDDAFEACSPVPP